MYFLTFETAPVYLEKVETEAIQKFENRQNRSVYYRNRPIGCRFCMQYSGILLFVIIDFEHCVTAKIVLGFIFVSYLEVRGLWITCHNPH